MSETVELRKDRILEAARKCSTAKGVLETLFPDVFKAKELKDGAVYELRDDGIMSGNHYLCLSIDDTYLFKNINTFMWWSLDGTLSLPDNFKQVANSPEDYFRQKYSK